jgi:hypothetical protein
VTDASLDPPAERALAVSLHGRSWTLLELPSRTAAQDDELVHAAHASAHHWLAIGTAANRSRAENQCARVYAALGRGEPALHHAGRCLELVRAEPDAHEDWDLASAFEVAARAHLAAGDGEAAATHAALARAELARIADADDRAVIAEQVAEVEALLRDAAARADQV